MSCNRLERLGPTPYCLGPKTESPRYCWQCPSRPKRPENTSVWFFILMEAITSFLRSGSWATTRATSSFPELERRNQPLSRSVVNRARRASSSTLFRQDRVGGTTLCSCSLYLVG